MEHRDGDVVVNGALERHPHRRFAATLFAQALVQFWDRRIRLLLDGFSQLFQIDLDHSRPTYR